MVLLMADSYDPDLHAVQERLLAWFAAHGRDLPWRHTRDPYAILVAEIMLQQTGVERVRPKYEAWLARFPTLQALAAAPRSEVIRLWSGLGYNSRAVRLHDVARQVVARHVGQLPETMEGLLTLKGIGRYTAGAVAPWRAPHPVHAGRPRHSRPGGWRHHPAPGPRDEARRRGPCGGTRDGRRAARGRPTGVMTIIPPPRGGRVVHVTYYWPVT